MSVFLDKLNETISRLEAATGGGKIICAVSGGPDSVAMLLMLREMLPDTFGLTVAHFDHNIREESGRDAQWVKDLAGSLDLPFYPGSDNVRVRAGILRMNLEEAARDSRRGFLIRLARDIGAIRVALGHTLDDQATTALMNLARGTGSVGLSAMDEDDGYFLRPVIKYGKSELVGYLNEREHGFLKDHSNEDLSLTRNRIERIVLPELTKTNPGAVANIANASFTIKEQNVYLDELIIEMFEEVVEEKDDSALLSNLFLSQGFVFKAILKKAFSRIAPTTTLETSHYDEVVGLDDGGSANLPGGIIASRIGGSLSLRAARRPTIEEWSAEVTIPGELFIPDIGLEVVITKGPAPPEFAGQKGQTAWLRTGVCGDTIIVRSRSAGDVFRPSGGNGKRRIKDYYIDEKIPAENRVKVPLVETGGEIIWVVGYRIAEGVSPAPGEESIVISIVPRK